MFNDRRRFFFILFFTIFVPIVVALVLTLFMPPSKRQAADNGQAPSFLSRSRAAMVGTRAGDHDLLAAGSSLLAAGWGGDFWIAHPFFADGRDAHTPFYELLHFSANAGVWSVYVHNGESFWQSFPQALALVPSPGDATYRAIPLVMNEQGGIQSFSTDSVDTAEGLPATHKIKAAVGSSAGVFAITQGAPPATATRPGDRLTPYVSYYQQPMGPEALAARFAPATAPATTASSPLTAPSTTGPAPSAVEGHAPTSAPASTAASAPAIPPFFNTYWYHEGHWFLLPALGKAGVDSSNAPVPSSLIALAANNSRLLALWVDSARPGTLVVRSLEFAKPEPAWSQPFLSQLPEQVPPVSRLLMASVGGTPYVFWPVPTNGPMELHGGVLRIDPNSETPYSLPAKNMLPPLSLDKAGVGISPATDVALGTAENALVVVVSTKDGGLANLVFDSQGRRLSGPATVEPQSLRLDVQVGQNLLLILLILVFSLSLWQWRQKSTSPVLPPGLAVAPVHLRIFAGLIDIALPYIATLIIFQQWNSGFALISLWVESLSHPEHFLDSPEFFTFLGIYLGHVLLGEALFRRSLGKWLLGLQVLMADGRRPTFTAILLRNLIRIPELLVGVVILYILMSDQHQRLGDLLARTLVVAREDPEAPADSSRKDRD